MKLQRFGLMFLLLAAICAAKKQPADPKFLAIENLSVLPLIDAR